MSTKNILNIEKWIKKQGCVDKEYIKSKKNIKK